MSKYKALYWLLLSFLGGVGLASLLKIENTYVYVAIIIGLLMWALSWRIIPIPWNKRWPFIIAGLCLIMFALGVWRLNSIAQRYQSLTQFVKAREGLVKPSMPNKALPVAIEGHVDEIPQIVGDQQQLIISVQIWRAFGSYLYLDTNERVLALVPRYPSYAYGDKLELTGDVFAPQNSRSSDFDYAGYLSKDGIFTIMRLPEVVPADITYAWPTRFKIGLYQRIYHVRDAFQSAIGRSVAEPEASLIGGVLLGIKSRIPDDVTADFARAGVSHIVAISGYNITIVIGVLSWFLLWFVNRRRALWCIVFGVFCFAIMTGAGGSVLRASLMGLIVLFARQQGRQSDAVSALILALFLMVLYQPMIMRYDVGFQLSVMATLGLIYLSPIFERAVTRWSKAWGMKEIFIMTCAAQLAVLPLILFYFKNLSLIAVPANILILPLIPALMFMGFFAGLAGIFMPVAGYLFGIIAWIPSHVVIWLSRLLSHVPGAVVAIHFDWYLVVLSYVILVLFVLKYDRPTTADIQSGTAAE